MANDITPARGEPLPSADATGAEQVASRAKSIPISNSRSGIAEVLARHRRLILLAASSLMMLGFISLVLWSAEPPYRILFSGISEQDAAAVVDSLNKEHIPYRLEAGGAILVPANQVYTARLKLAGQGAMPEKGVGFELFDKNTPFGVSDFAQQVNYQRALQGELAKTIEVLPQVAAARVHLVLPKESAFVTRRRKASASVMLQLAGGQRLPRRAILAIQNLVSASVPNLDRQDVTIVDSAGNLLSSDKERAAMGAGRSEQEYEAKVERRLEERLTGMLEQLVGRGQAVVRVTADINREYVEQNSRRFNPDESVLRNERLIEESRQSTEPGTGGVPGIAANTPGKSAAQKKKVTGRPADEAKRRERSSNYEISSTTEKKIIPFGSIRRLSVAVIVGGSYREENGKRVFVPRDQKELDAMRNLIKRAIGYDEDRGDTLEVRSLPIVDIRDSTDAAALNAVEKQAFYMAIARYGLAGLSLLLLAWFVLRPVARRLGAGTKQTQEEEQEEDLANRIEDDIARAGEDGTLALPDIGPQHLEWQQAAKELISEDPNLATRILYQWTRQE